jgi:hypothetical protein
MQHIAAAAAALLAALACASSSSSSSTHNELNGIIGMAVNLESTRPVPQLFPEEKK